MKPCLKRRRPAGRACARRTVAVRAWLACLVMTSLPLTALTAAPLVAVVAEPPIAPPNAHYVGHRPPLLPAPLLKLPVGAVRPEGWLRRVLRLYSDRGWKPVVSPELEFYLTKVNEDPDYPLQPPIGAELRR